MVFALALTVVILLGYGGYTAWNKVFGGGSSSDTSQVATSDYSGSVSRAIYFGGQVLGEGLGVRLVDNLAPFKFDADRSIEGVRAARAEVAALLPGATGARADVLNSTIQTLDQLEAAMTQWRDAVYAMRFASVPTAHSAVDSAIAQLQSDLDRWKTLPS